MKVKISPTMIFTIINIITLLYYIYSYMTTIPIVAHIKSCTSNYRKCYFNRFTLSSNCADYCVYFNIFNISMTNNIRDFNLEYKYYIKDFDGYTNGNTSYTTNYFKMVVIFTITLLICIMIDNIILLTWDNGKSINVYSFIISLIVIPLIYITITSAIFYSKNVECTNFKNIDVETIDETTGGTTYYNAIGRLSNGIWYEYYINRLNDIYNTNNCYLYKNKLYSFNIQYILIIIGVSMFYINVFILLLPTLIKIIKDKFIYFNDYVEILEVSGMPEVVELTESPEISEMPEAAELTESPEISEMQESLELTESPELTESLESLESPELTELSIGPE